MPNSLQPLLDFYKDHPERWCKGAAAVDKDGNTVSTSNPAAVSFCLLGATYKLGVNRMGIYHRLRMDGWPQLTIPEWNDSHTFDELIEMLSRED